jgi:hypothetical protein
MKGFIVIPGKYCKEHSKDVKVAGTEDVQAHVKADTIKTKDLPKNAKGFEVKNGKVQKKVKAVKVKVKK